MSKIRTKTTCPLGSKCEELLQDEQGPYLAKCAWYVPIEGTDPQGNDVNESRCSMSWMPMLQLEMSSTNRGQTQALNSFRDEVVEGNKHALSLKIEQLRVNSHSNLPPLPPLP